MKIDVATKVATALWLGLLGGAVLQYHFGESKTGGGTIVLVPYERVEPNFYLPETVFPATPIGLRDYRGGYWEVEGEVIPYSVPPTLAPEPAPTPLPVAPEPEPEPEPTGPPSRIQHADYRLVT